MSAMAFIRRWRRLGWGAAWAMTFPSAREVWDRLLCRVVGHGEGVRRFGGSVTCRRCAHVIGGWR